MRKNKPFGIRVASVALALTMTCSFTFSDLSALQVRASETDGIELTGEEAYDPFGRILFGDLFEDELFVCSDSKVEAENSQTNKGVFFTGKNAKVKDATFTIGQTIDFGEEGANRVMIDAVAKRGTKTYIQVFVDDETDPIAEGRVIAQKREDNWERYEEINVLLSKDLVGEHTIYFKILDTDTADDKKTTVLFRSMKFVRDVIPVVNLDIDESFGSIDDMNRDEDHITECYGDMSIVVPSNYQSEFDIKGETYTGGTYQLDYIRGRGNSTWSEIKKPYKIKLDEKADLFNMGANKHWVLLANWFDNSLVRNRMTYWLGRELGMQYTPEGVSVDVYMNNEYLGNYFLCEQIRVDKERVDIFDLEKEYEKKAMKETDNLSGGYLLSMSPYGNEKGYGFRTDYGCTFYLESPESTYDTMLAERIEINYDNYGDYDSDIAVGSMEDDPQDTDVEPDNSPYALANAYISDYVQKLENAIFSPDFEYVDENGDAHHYSEYMDVDSAVKYFWMQELSDNGDAYVTPSTYLYKDKDGLLCWGPLWDFDFVAWGSTAYNDYDEDDFSYSGWMRNNVWFEQLMEDEEFVQKVKDYWENELKPTLEQKVINEGGLLDQYQEELVQSAYNNYDKYGMMGNGIDTDDYYAIYNEDAYETQDYTFEQEIERLKSWISHRISWIDANLDALEPQPVKVNFMVDGKLYETMDGKTNRVLETFPEAPTKEGCDFVGWFLDADYEFAMSDYIRDNMVGKDGTVVLNAVWSDEDIEVPVEYIHITQKDIYHAFYDDEELDMEYGFDMPFSYVAGGRIKPLTWSSSDESIAVVDKYGYVVAKGIGDVVITVTTAEGKTASANVHIIPVPGEDYEQYILKDIEMSDSSVVMKPDEKKGIGVKTVPEVVLYPFNVPYIQWKSLNEDIVTVEDGIITAKKPGKTFVVAVYMSDEDFTWKYCEVIVEGDATTPTVKPGNNTGDSKPGTTKPGATTPGTTPGNTGTTESIKVNTVFEAGNLKYVVTNASKLEVAVKGLKKNKSKVVIPKQVSYSGKTFKVTSIAKNAFANNKKIKSVVIGKNVVKIGSKAFYKCKKCKSVTIKTTTLKKPGKQAFKKMSKKAKVTVPAKSLKKYKKWFKGYKVAAAK